jgi:hypothetical protein
MKPEEFMREYFSERTEKRRAELIQHEPFRRKFYTSDSSFDSRQWAVEQSEKEEVLEVTHADNGEAQVITSGIGIGERRRRQRYHLQPADNKWLIHSGEFECGICHGSGKKKDGTTDCPLCKGRGWMGAA